MTPLVLVDTTLSKFGGGVHNRSAVLSVRYLRRCLRIVYNLDNKTRHSGQCFSDPESSIFMALRLGMDSRPRQGAFSCVAIHLVRENDG